MPVTRRFCLRVRLIRRWPFQPCVRMIFPVPVFLNRFAAARRVLTFGIVRSLVFRLFRVFVVFVFFRGETLRRGRFRGLRSDRRGFFLGRRQRRFARRLQLRQLGRLGGLPRLDLLDRGPVRREHHRQHAPF